MSSSVVRARAHCRARPKIKHRQVERLDRKLADAISSNIVQKCDVTLSRAIQPLRSEVLFVCLFWADRPFAPRGHVTSFL